MKSKKILIFFLVVGLLLAFFATQVYVYINKPSTGLKVYFFDVGQGDACLIQTANGENILIDGGPDNKVLSELSKVLPWWERELDLMILTHPHDDHVAGLNNILDKYSVNKILYTGVSHNGPAYLSWLDKIKEQEQKVKIIERTQEIKLDNDCNFKILFPTESFLNKTVVNFNNTSIVAQLDCEGKKILFMGDAEQELENELLKNYSDLDSDIIKIGHHGSETASGEEFLKAVSPETAIVSVGEDNKFGLPDLRILRRLERLGINVLRTDEGGTIVENF
ncbi:MAG: MBL fold metallo-hydrolase [Candidatus Magasanikbacteria bacterium]|nr:MBL fold metallo-hydrolase [Candidatus Magasanikbacteria bacterium]